MGAFLSNICDAINIHHLSLNHTESKKEYNWLEKVIREAEAKDEYIYILELFNGVIGLIICGLIRVNWLQL